MSTYTLGDIFLVNGQRVELPAQWGAAMGFQRAPDLNATPFAPTTSSAPTLNLSKAPISTTSTGPGDPCAGLASRVARYGANDPQPLIRRILVEKCEEQRRAGGVRVSDVPTGYPEPEEGMDPKVKIAIGAGAALALGFVAWKVLGK